MQFFSGFGDVQKKQNLARAFLVFQTFASRPAPLNEYKEKRRALFSTTKKELLAKASVRIATTTLTYNKTKGNFRQNTLS